MESASQRSLHALETELENLTQQLNASVISLNQHSLQMESASQRSLDALETALENLTQQLNASVMFFNKQESKRQHVTRATKLLITGAVYATPGTASNAIDCQVRLHVQNANREFSLGREQNSNKTATLLGNKKRQTSKLKTKPQNIE